MENEILNSMEYRQAFMNFCVKGEKMPQEFRNGDVTKTTDAGVVIPTFLVEKIFEKMESVGRIANLVTRTNYKGGVTVPVSSVRPTASWVNEGAGSDTQKLTITGITFAYHKLQVRIATTLEMDVLSIEAFEALIVRNVTDALVKAIEQAIISGNGSGKPKGILAETVVTGQNVDIASNADITYGDLVNAEGLLPIAYENGAKWFMTKKTWAAIEGMVDDNGQPIARINYGLGKAAERYLLGREVILNDYMTSYASSVDADTVVAFLFRPEDYVLNTAYELTVRKYTDEATDDEITKATMLCDGKVVDKNSLVTVTKKA